MKHALRAAGAVMLSSLALTSLAIALVLAFGAPAQAQGFPTRPVTFVVPWPAGGSTDIGMRALAAATEKHLGQSIVIENKPGAAGTIGPANMAANAKPDGYTVAQLPITVFRLPFIQKTSFDPASDFTYIIHVTGYTFGVAVKADAPWKTFQELLDYAKANPGKVNYGTPGAGSSNSRWNCSSAAPMRGRPRPRVIRRSRSRCAWDGCVSSSVSSRRASI